MRGEKLTKGACLWVFVEKEERGGKSGDVLRRDRSSAIILFFVLMYFGAIVIWVLASRSEHRMEVICFARGDVVHGLVSQIDPEVLSMRCSMRGCGNLVGVGSVDNTRHVPAMSMMVVANSRSLIDMRGL